MMGETYPEPCQTRTPLNGFSLFSWNLHLLFKKLILPSTSSYLGILFIDVFVNTGAIRHKYVA